MDRATMQITDDVTIAGFTACYHRLPHADRRRFWQCQTLTEKLLILAGIGGAETTSLAARVHVLATQEAHHAAN